jgi:hypothetical protein
MVGSLCHSLLFSIRWGIGKIKIAESISADQAYIHYGPPQSQPAQHVSLAAGSQSVLYIARLPYWSIVMNTKHIVVSIAFCLSGASAFAQSAEFTAPDAGFKSMQSRAQVTAEAGGMPGAKDGVYPVITTRSTMSRDQVRGNVMPTATKQNHASGLYFG